MYNYKKKDFSHDVYTALDGCLSCKACAKACPVNIDISLLKSEFLEQYHSRYRHSLRDYLVGYIETLLQYIGFMGTYLNWVLNNPISKGFLQLLGLYDLPPFSSFKKKMVAHLSKTHLLSWKNLSKCNTYDKEKTVIILPDSFSYFYRGSLITSYCETLENLGYTVLLFPWLPIGKSLHIKGFLKAFKRQAKKTSTLLNSLQEYGIPLLGIDPAMTLCLRDEYKHVLSEEKLNFKVLLFQEWIEKETIPPQNPKENTTYYLLEHCAEKTLIPNSSQRWVTAFKKCGLNLHPIDVGCCGMAGTYGHETRHKVQSKAIYDLSWKDIVDQYPEQVLTTGFSCYEQILRYKNSPIKHPIEILV